MGDIYRFNVDHELKTVKCKKAEYKNTHFSAKLNKDEYIYYDGRFLGFEDFKKNIIRANVYHYGIKRLLNFLWIEKLWNIFICRGYRNSMLFKCTGCHSTCSSKEDWCTCKLGICNNGTDG